MNMDDERPGARRRVFCCLSVWLLPVWSLPVWGFPRSGDVVVIGLYTYMLMPLYGSLPRRAILFEWRVPPDSEGLWIREMAASAVNLLNVRLTTQGNP